MKLLIGLILLNFVLGCATTKTPPVLNEQIQIKVIHLEQRLEKRDQEMDDLKYELETVRKRLEDLEMYRMPVNIEEFEPPVDSITPLPNNSDMNKKEGVVRVSANIKEIQSALKNAGYYNGEIDGKVGRKTKHAIGSFQKDHELSADGIVGPKTWEELKNYLQ